MDGFAELLGVAFTDAVDGAARLELDADERHLNPAGTVHGGVLATLLDTAMGQAVRSTRDDVPATSQLTVTFLRPGRPGRLVITGRVGKQGQHLVVCDGDVEQDGQAVASAVATFAIVG
jgi:uncharacterized protein (TIGR00369 family)